MLVLILLIQSERLKWRVTAKTFLKEAAMVRQCKAKKLKNQSLENFKKQCPPQKKKKKIGESTLVTEVASQPLYKNVTMFGKRQFGEGFQRNPKCFPL